jgi:hypothetical protein
MMRPSSFPLVMNIMLVMAVVVAVVMRVVMDVVVVGWKVCVVMHVCVLNVVLIARAVFCRHPRLHLARSAMRPWAHEKRSENLTCVTRESLVS